MPLALAVVWITLLHGDPAEPIAITDRPWHLRATAHREWNEFAERPDAAHLDREFEAAANADAWTLVVRQQDVKQTWVVTINGQRIGTLRIDENDMVIVLPVPAGTLVQGTNTLGITQEARRELAADDIRVGPVTLVRDAASSWLGAAKVEVVVSDTGTGRPTPSRLTILDHNGSLASTSAESNDTLAVRPGIVYTSTGTARFGLPAGSYTVYAGRGFEYSLDSRPIDLAAGDRAELALRISRQVPTEGYVACDTHVHTLTHSGHGDATIAERMITLAGEGIELPIATDHNKHINYEPFARELGVRRYFTPVIGNEVTTRVGHFNIFPVEDGAAVPRHDLGEWGAIFDSIFATPHVRVVILNHGRDLHGGTRPLGPELFDATTGEHRAGWPMRFNAMEVVNSAATQTDPLELARDWMALVNRGYNVAPIGSSDSHDVGRHFVGQARTYIRCDDTDPSTIDVGAAVESVLAGRVMMSYGLLAELVVEGRYGSGDLAPLDGDTVAARVRVLGPDWVRADRLLLFAGGRQVQSIAIPDGAAARAGVKFEYSWTLDRPKRDVFLVAIATGPGIDASYWKTAKPYQPSSPEWQAQVIGLSGAVWLDADGDGRKTSAYEHGD